MRSYKEILRFLIIREQLSLGWKLAFFVVCGALLYGSLAIRDMRIQSVDVKGTVLKDRTDAQEGTPAEYLTVRLESGVKIKASASLTIDYRPGREVIVKETTANFFGVKRYEFKKYVDEPGRE